MRPIRSDTPYPFGGRFRALPIGQGQSRTTLVPGDRFRNYAAVWAVAGVPQPGSAVLTGGGRTVPVTLGRFDVAFWLPSFGNYWRVQIPDTTPPGQYTLNLGGPQTWAFTVAPTPKPRKLVPLPANVAAATAAAALSAGNDVVLPPGGLRFAAQVPVPSGANVYGDGCRLTYAPKLGQRAVFLVGNDVGIHGLDWVEHYGTSDVGMLVNAPGGATGLVVRHCTIRDGLLGWWIVDAVVESNDLAGGGAIIAPTGLWFDNDLRNTRPGLQPLVWWYGSGCTAAFRHRFTRSLRGTVFQCGQPICDNLYVGAYHAEIAVDGGGEVYLKEGPGQPFDRNMIYDTRVVGSSSAVFALDNNASANVVSDAYLEGDCEVRFGSAGGGVNDNTIQRFHLPQGRITCYAGATNNLFDTGDVGGACRSADPSNVLHAVTAPDASGFTVRV